MGDFFVDLRRKEQRQAEKAGAFLKFFPDLHTYLLRFEEVDFVVTSPDDPELWAPYTNGEVTVTVCGRVALRENQWAQARNMPGEGGLAAKYIASEFRREGVAALEKLDGNFVVLLLDQKLGNLFIVTDPMGLQPAFQSGVAGNAVFSSHPDALADSLGETWNWDGTSFAEFILKGKVSFPYTYYKNVRALPNATVLEFRKEAAGWGAPASRPYLRFDFVEHVGEEELAEEFSAAMRDAVCKRTLPVLGQSAIALSGGLDSRTILAAAPRHNDVLTFSCFDAENVEFSIARAIAAAAGARFIPLQRPFEYYGENASLGVRISGGMGCIASNHFLGFRSTLRELGVRSVLTGCYCDYLFKGLGLNKQVGKWTLREDLAPFSFSYYAWHFQTNTAASDAASQRLNDLFPQPVRDDRSERGFCALENRRIFPLFYEEDNAQRTIPQRVMGWCPPVGDQALLNVRRKLSTAMKLNRALFVRMVEKVCGQEIANVPDANTGAPVNASALSEAFHYYQLKVRRKLRCFNRSVVGTGSWPNWEVYLTTSQKVRSLWHRPNKHATEVFKAVLGEDYSPDLSSYTGRRFYILLQLFTLKLWFDERTGCAEL